MTTLNVNRSTSVYVPIGKALIFNASSGAGNVVRTSSGAEPGSPVAVTGVRKVFGPYGDDAYFTINCTLGVLDYVIDEATGADGARDASNDVVNIGGINQPLADALVRSSRLSSAYRFMIPGKQFIGSSNGRDISGKGADAIIATPYTDAELWANRGYMTTASGLGKGVYVPLDKTNFDLATQSVIAHFRLNMALPASSIAIFGNGDNSTYKGFCLSARAATGKIIPILNTSTGPVTNLAASNAVFCDGTDHDVLIAIDSVTKAVYLYCDGILSNQYLNTFTGDTAANIVSQFVLGGTANANPKVSGSFASTKIAGVGLMVFDGGLPLNLNYIAQRIAANPYIGATASEVLG